MNLRIIYNFFAKPFKEDFVFLLIMSLLVCIPRFIELLFYNQGISVSIWEIAHSYLLCYFIALAFQLVPLKWENVYKYFFLNLAFVDFCIDAACWTVTKQTFNAEHVSIIMGTNLSEGKEFISTYIKKYGESS